jgi:hypothetical protein
VEQHPTIVQRGGCCARLCTMPPCGRARDHRDWRYGAGPLCKARAAILHNGPQESGGWRVEGGEWRVESGGWRVTLAKTKCPSSARRPRSSEDEIHERCARRCVCMSRCGMESIMGVRGLALAGLAKEGRLEEAIPLFRQVLEADPDSADGFGRGRCQFGGTRARLSEERAPNTPTKRQRFQGSRKKTPEAPRVVGSRGVQSRRK